jgi:Domain of unknown function (DUF5615)
VLAFLADENFKGGITSGLRLRCPELDIVRVQDVGLSAVDDEVILAWAAQSGRLLLTHDAATMTKYAYERTAAGLPMPGVVEVPRRLRLGHAIDEILLLAQCSREGEWQGQVVYLPL